MNFQTTSTNTQNRYISPQFIADLTPPKTHILSIAEQKVVRAPDKLSTLGLGSCVGLVLYGPSCKIGGMVHIMLPEAPKDVIDPNLAKYADTAIPALLRRLVTAGAMPRRILAKLAGGAHMFNTSRNLDIMNVGERNVKMCKKLLFERSIPIMAEDTGGSCGRSIEFDCETGLLKIRTVSPLSTKQI